MLQQVGDDAAGALYVAVLLVPNLDFAFEPDDAWLKFLIVAFIFGLVNTFVRPVLRILTFPITMMTLGLFLFVPLGWALLTMLVVGIFFFGPSEPLAYYTSPPPHTVEAGTAEALHQAMAQSHYHWGLHAWALYALVGGAIAYSSYRRGRVSLVSSVFRSLFGDRHTDGVAGKIVDIFAIIATLFGTAATLGIAAIQIGEGVSIISGAGPLGNTALLVIIAVLTLAFIISAVSGVTRGIRYLSNINITLTLGAVLFVFIAGPTLFLLNLIPSGVMHYFDEMFSMMGKSLSWGAETVEFQSAWTAFYWAWWIAWTPFVGMFIARISRGRTLREFVLVAMGVPTAILVLAFSIFGGTAIWMNTQGVPGFDGSATPEQVLFSMFGQFPLSEFTPFVLITILAIFFVTSADSASVVMGTMSSRGTPAPRTWSGPAPSWSPTGSRWRRCGTARICRFAVHVASCCFFNDRPAGDRSATAKSQAQRAQSRPGR